MSKQLILVKIVQDEGTVLYKNLSSEDKVTINDSFSLAPGEQMTFHVHIPHQHKYICECGEEHDSDDDDLEDW